MFRVSTAALFNFGCNKENWQSIIQGENKQCLKDHLVKCLGYFLPYLPKLRTANMQADRPKLRSWLPASLLNTAPIPVAVHVYIQRSVFTILKMNPIGFSEM